MTSFLYRPNWGMNEDEEEEEDPNEFIHDR